MKTQEQLVQELDAKIPRDCISSREGGGRSKLSYLEGWYVIDRLNKTVGQGFWAYTSDVNLVHSDMANNSVHYIAKVRLAVKFPNGETTEFSDYGYGDGKDKYSIGKAHELAVKEAVTDGLKRCAKNLGMSLGLALYDKTQENVEESEPARPAAQAAPKAAPKAVAPTPKQGGINPTTAVLITKESEAILAKAGLKDSPERAAKLTELRANLKTKYGVEKASELTEEQGRELLANLKEMANG